MAKKLLVVTLILVLLSACITITKLPNSSVPQQDFVTVTLPPTATKWMPISSTIPPETGTPPTVITASTNCTDAAILLRDVTIPDHTHVKSGEIFIKTWEFQNIGTCSWTDYIWKFTSGDEIDAPASAPMPMTASKEKVQVSMKLTAPTADGAYAGYFALYNADGNVVPIGTEKTFWVNFIVGNSAVIPAASGGSPVQSGNCIHSQNAGYASQLLSMINTERTNAGLSSLSVDTDIAAFAQSHAEDMAFNNFLSHDGSEGSFGERIARYNMGNSGYRIFGEILAIGTPQDAMDQWQRDEHWDYVLGSFTQIGVGYAYNSCSDFGGYFTVDFGS